MQNQTLGEIAYQAYGKTTDFKNFMGNPMPKWEELTDKIREAWGNAAEAIYSKLIDTTGGIAVLVGLDFRKVVGSLTLTPEYKKELEAVMLSIMGDHSREIILGYGMKQNPAELKGISFQLSKPVKKENKPTVVCLCGSTRFYKEFQRLNYEETMKGNIVLSVGFYPHASEEMHGEKIGINSEQKMALDELHKRKIDMADEVLVINVGGYIGESTKSEIEYAMRLNKTVRYLEDKITIDLHSQVGKSEDLINSIADLIK